MLLETRIDKSNFSCHPESGRFSGSFPLRDPPHLEKQAMHRIQRPAQTLLLAITAVSCGCGTIHNLIDGPSIYGGVVKVINDPFIPKGASKEDWILAMISIPGNFIDLTLSAIADTIVLPFTVPYELISNDSATKDDSRSAHITGHVYDAQGNPIGNALVTNDRSSGTPYGDHRLSVNTDSQGCFTLWGRQPPCDIVLTAYKTGYKLYSGSHTANNYDVTITLEEASSQNDSKAEWRVLRENELKECSSP